nr:hypothetical protein GCM10020093_120400 [Planobispora longispora]
MPGVPVTGELGLDAGVAGLAEDFLDAAVDLLLARQVGELRVLDLAAGLQELVPHPDDAGGGDAVAQAVGDGVHGRGDHAAHGVQFDALAAVALGVGVGDVLPRHVERLPLGVQGAE